MSYADTRLAAATTPASTRRTRRAPFGWGRLPDDLKQHVVLLAGEPPTALRATCGDAGDVVELWAAATLVEQGRFVGVDRYEGWLSVDEKPYHRCRKTRLVDGRVLSHRKLAAFYLNRLMRKENNNKGKVVGRLTALLARAAHEDWLLTRHRHHLVEYCRLLSLGEDATVGWDTTLVKNSTLDSAFLVKISAGLAHMRDALSSLDVRSNIQLTNDLSRKLLPRKVFQVKDGAVDASEIGYAADGEARLREAHANGLLGGGDASISIAIFQGKNEQPPSSAALRRLRDAKEASLRAAIYEGREGQVEGWGLNDVLYWAKLMLMSDPTTRALINGVRANLLRARCEWGSEGDIVEDCGALQNLLRTMLAIASDENLTSALDAAEASDDETVLEGIAARVDDLFSRAGGFDERIAAAYDVPLAGGMVAAELSGITDYAAAKQDLLRFLADAPAGTELDAYALIGGGRLAASFLGPFLLRVGAEDLFSTKGIVDRIPVMKRPFFEVVGLALTFALLNNGDELPNDPDLLETLVDCIANWSGSGRGRSTLLGCTYVEIAVVFPGDDVKLLRRSDAYHAGARLPTTAPELRALRTVDHATYGAVHELRARVASYEEDLAAPPADGGDAAATTRSLPLAGKRIWLHQSAKRATFDYKNTTYKAAALVIELGGEIVTGLSNMRLAAMLLVGDTLSAHPLKYQVSQKKAALRVSYLKAICEGDTLPDPKPYRVFMPLREARLVNPHGYPPGYAQGDESLVAVPFSPP